MQSQALPSHDVPKKLSQASPSSGLRRKARKCTDSKRNVTFYKRLGRVTPAGRGEWITGLAQRGLARDAVESAPAEPPRARQDHCFLRYHLLLHERIEVVQRAEPRVSLQFCSEFVNSWTLCACSGRRRCWKVRSKCLHKNPALPPARCARKVMLPGPRSGPPPVHHPENWAGP